ncbi:hypothetical protein GCM10011514_09270 [Emticicia aquatilis]|uniref:Uncharacterized protein n=1 Tax=Emticicia aquatilis TaxID=1537369 RepID=A0A917DL05_9BACT|nr:hypothetical protein GCM10011514_09270 [Emticicia aquatilis]
MTHDKPSPVPVAVGLTYLITANELIAIRLKIIKAQLSVNFEVNCFFMVKIDLGMFDYSAKSEERFDEVFYLSIMKVPLILGLDIS